MPFREPPCGYEHEPSRYRLPAGTVVWRVHPQSCGPAEFKEVPADRHFGGGRFDGTADDPYPFLYAALTDRTALAETLVRALPFAADGSRTLSLAAVAGRALCPLEVTADLTLLSLVTHPDLAAVEQDEWLVQAEPKEYAFTRRWGHSLREHNKWAQGLAWASRRDLGERSVVLFGDRCADSPLKVYGLGSRNLDDDDGVALVNELLAPYHVQIDTNDPADDPGPTA